MSKNQNKTSLSDGSGSSRGDVLFIRATSNSNTGQSTSGTTSLSNQQTSHFPHPSYSSQEISHHRYQPTPDISPHPHSHSLTHHHPHHPPPKPHHQPADLSDQTRFLMTGVGEALTPPVHTGVETWGTREEALAAELEEAKIRVAQMEKTMRWWSDCTSNWREKWNKARNERNKAREENRLLRVKMESLSKDVSRLKREKKDVSNTKNPVKSDADLNPTKALNSDDKSLENLSEKERSILAKADDEKESESTDELSETSSPKRLSKNNDVNASCDLESRECGQYLNSPSVEKDSKAGDRIFELEEELIQCQLKSSQALENLVMMQRKLDEANNAIQVERLENCSQTKVIQNLKTQIMDLQVSLDEMTKSKSNLRAELDTAKETHREELNRLSLDLEDESSSRSSMDRHLMDLRRELERLQAENACEWGKREQLETEKQVLDRDNKKLRTQVADLEEEVERLAKASSCSVSSDIKTLQFDLAEKNKELSEIKHLNSKLKKVISEKGISFEHSKRRIEQYEAEVKKLRGRVDELKHDLVTAEDELDSQTNACRKTQRSNDELQEQVDGLQVQVNHLQSRLRSGSSVAPLRSASLKTLDLDLEDDADSQNEDEDDD